MFNTDWIFRMMWIFRSRSNFEIRFWNFKKFNVFTNLTIGVKMFLGWFCQLKLLPPWIVSILYMFDINACINSLGWFCQLQQRPSWIVSILYVFERVYCIDIKSFLETCDTLNFCICICTNLLTWLNAKRNIKYLCDNLVSILRVLQ